MRGALAGLLLTGCAVEAAAPDPRTLVRAALVASTEAVVPGQPFWVGVRYTVAPGWHIYWENPGDSGLATTVDLRPGPGLTAGPVRYPGPDRFELPGGIANFGYEGEAALLAELTPRPQLKVGERVRVAWASTWLACQEACVRGSAEGALDLVVGSSARKTGALDPFLERLPRSVEALGGAASWAGAAQAPERVVRVPGFSSGLFFPSRALSEVLRGQRVAPEAGGVTLALTLDPAGLSPGADLRGVLRLDGPSGPAWAEIPVPAPPAAQP